MYSQRSREIKEAKRIMRVSHEPNAKAARRRLVHCHAGKETSTHVPFL